jgi:hypothetical protein
MSTKPAPAPLLPRTAWLPVVKEYLNRELTQLTTVTTHVQRLLAVDIGSPPGSELQQEATALITQQQTLLAQRQGLLAALQSASGQRGQMRLLSFPWTPPEQAQLADLRCRILASAAQLSGVVRAGRTMLLQRSSLFGSLLRLAGGAAPYEATYTSTGDRVQPALRA